MQVWRGAAPGGPDVSDDVVLADLLPDLNVEARQMTKPRRQTIAVIDDDEVPVRGFPLRVNDFSVSGRVDLSSEQGGDIHTEMKFRFSVKRIRAVAIMAGDTSFDRPERGSNPPDGGFFLRDLVQQRELAFHLRGSILK